MAGCGHANGAASSADVGVALRQSRQDRAAGGVGEGPEHGVQLSVRRWETSPLCNVSAIETS